MDIKKKIYFSHENIFSLLEIVLKRFCYEYGFQPINSFRRNSAQMRDSVAALDNVIWKKNCQKKKNRFIWNSTLWDGYPIAKRRRVFRLIATDDGFEEKNTNLYPGIRAAFVAAKSGGENRSSARITKNGKK